MPLNNKRIRDIICQYFNSIAGVNTVYLFGSAVTKRIPKAKDLDLAILFKGDNAEFDLIEAVSYLSRQIGKEVDIVILNRASELLKFQVRKRKALILDKDTAFRKRFEIQSRRSFEDYLHIHRIYTTSLMKKVLADGGLPAN